MTKLYFVRHGETVWNKAGRYQGWTDIPLSEEGLWQAECLAKRFQDIPIDAIYTSSLQRAYETARPVAEQKGMKPIVDDSFKEINFGEWEGHTIPELREKLGEPYIQFFNDPFAHTFPGDGSFQNVTKRIQCGLDAIFSEYKDKNVLVISHGGIVRLAIMHLMEMDNSFYRKLWIDNTGISILELSDEAKLLRSLNDVAHLDWFGKERR